MIARNKRRRFRENKNRFQSDGVEATTGIEPVYTVLQTVA
jgi:hypothetical protein